MEGMSCCDGYLPRFSLTRWPSCGEFSADIWDPDDSPLSPYLWAPSVTVGVAGSQPLSKYSRVPVHFSHAGLRRCKEGLYHHCTGPHTMLLYLWAPLPPLRVCLRSLVFLPVLPLTGSRSCLFARGLLLTQLSSFISDVQKPSWHFSPTESTRPFPVPPPQLRKSGGNKLKNELTFAAGSQVWFAKKWNPLRENATVGAGGAFSPILTTDLAKVNPSIKHTRCSDDI